MTNGRPSDKTTMPLQNMSQVKGWVVMVSVAGSHTPPWKKVTVLSFPDPVAKRILPLCISARCTGLIGARVTRVCHWPWRFACPAAGGADRIADSEQSKRATATERRLLTEVMHNPFGLLCSCNSMKTSRTPIAGQPQLTPVESHPRPRTCDLFRERNPERLRSLSALSSAADHTR